MLNREASQFSPEIGFTPDWFTRASGLPALTARLPPRAGDEGDAADPLEAAATSLHFESDDDTKRVRQLTADARNPSVYLTIAETADATTITDDSGETLTFHARRAP